MNDNLLKFGDHSLTIRYPSYRDRNTYTCSIINRRGEELMKKQVMLNVKVTKVKVESGAESIELPFKTDANLPEDAKVEWRDKENWTAHVFQDGADKLQQQSWYYRGRTEMRPNALKDKDLSLVVKHATESDCLTCTVYSTEGKILLRGEVLLQVKAHKEVVGPQQSAVELVFKTERKLECKDIKVEWRNRKDRKVYRYPSSDQSEEQFYSYKHRTEMKEGQIEKGDFSLVIHFPTDCDNDIYTCKVYRGDGTILMKKRVELHVKDHQVEVEDGCVTLPFKTKTDLLNESRIEWLLVEPTYRIVHVVDNRKSGSEQSEEQQPNRKGTKMNENLLETGDLTLTMEDITEDDCGKYKCVIFGKQGMILQEKTVQVLMTGMNQLQNEMAPLIDQV
ncbi:PREDICTED: uncharacterized protein LOC107103834 [Cyprinodon variegatus]|uniref:uncharacterized protein LOC107103834 n=1 Tax=Cyprinodon variegatus TaxID=28743 RepID=UPI000742BDD1|nr:PREDICTED: uncharacterized protein LOC107103834 [Cyprinodon variegatus]